MSFLELVRTRRSVRNYLQRPVEREKILKCIEAARLAPSACNSQPWKFIVVDDIELKNKIATETFGRVISFNQFSFQAPVIVVVVIESANITATLGRMIKNIPYQYIDVGIAIEHFCLQATEEGLGSCILGWFNEKPVRKILNIPQSKKIAALITVGYPESSEAVEKIRKPVEEVLSFNGYL
ncbi:MAG: nitroreductase family protein [Brevinematia bacterium]